MVSHSNNSFIYFFPELSLFHQTQHNRNCKKYLRGGTFSYSLNLVRHVFLIISHILFFNVSKRSTKINHSRHKIKKRRNLMFMEKNVLWIYKIYEKCMKKATTSKVLIPGWWLLCGRIMMMGMTLSRYAHCLLFLLLFIFNTYSFIFCLVFEFIYFMYETEKLTQSWIALVVIFCGKFSACWVCLVFCCCFLLFGVPIVWHRKKSKC